MGQTYEQPPTCLPCTSQLAYPAPHLPPTNPHPHQEATQAPYSFDQAVPTKAALPTPCGSRSMVPSHDEDPRPRPLPVHNSESENLREALNEPDPFSLPPVLAPSTPSTLEDRFSTNDAPRSPATNANAEAFRPGWARGEAVFRDEPTFNSVPQPRRPSYTHRFVASSAPPDVPLPSPLTAANLSRSAPVYPTQWTPNGVRDQDNDMNRQRPGGIAYRSVRSSPGLGVVDSTESPAEPSWAPTPLQSVGRPRALEPLANGNANTGTGVSITDQNTNNGYTTNIISPIPTYPSTTRATPPPVYSHTTRDAPPTYPTASSDRPPAYTPVYYGDEGDIEDIHDNRLRRKLNRLLFRSAVTTLATLYPSFPPPIYDLEDEDSEADTDGDGDDHDGNDDFQPIPSAVTTPPLRRQVEHGHIPIVATLPLRSLPPPQQQGITVNNAISSSFSLEIPPFYEEDTDDEEDNDEYDDDDDSDWSTSSSVSSLAAARIFSPRAGSPPPVSAFDFSDDDYDDIDDDDDDGDDDDDDDDNDDEVGPSIDDEADQIDFELELTNFFPSEWDWEELLRELADF
ncbi:hypothetical protein F5144DRAFT_492293 [Chaetomium tenue]|uniref:Uncharacterized protein n=1 Tax=Chaetomium tenue TaxID=1854479 RepID=A0ACB7P470_9PEZI|nr:hypothetical protein F5144DRAFT_492293 [Chaetomium globosum]